jgi:hypothetical protein
MHGLAKHWCQFYDTPMLLQHALTSGKGNYFSTQNLPHFVQNFAQNAYFLHCIPLPHATVTQILWTQYAQV